MTERVGTMPVTSFPSYWC